MATWNLDESIPVIELSAESVPGWSLDVSLPVISFTAELADGWSLDATLPVVEMDALITTETGWSLDAELPVVYMEGSFYALDVTTGRAICVNPSNQAHTEYTNYAFNSFCMFNGVPLGIGASGLFSLEGRGDGATNIDASLKFGPIDDDDSMMKRADSIYLNLRHDGDLYVTMTYDEVDTDYSLLDYNSGIDPEGIHTRRAKLSRSAEGRNLAVGLENVSGSDFEVTDLEALVIALTRHD